MDEEVVQSFSVASREVETVQSVARWKHELRVQIDGLALQRVGQRVRWALGDVLELSVLDQDGVNVLEEQSEGLVRGGSEFFHLSIEVAQELVDVLCLVGEE